MWEQLRRFNALERNARWMFVRAAVLLPLIWLSLRIRGFRLTHEMLQRLALNAFALTASGSSEGECLELSSADVRLRKEITARMVRAAARRGLAPATCLERSLALWFLLMRQRIASDLRIGARKIAGKFEAHAWVECDGEALNETPEVHCHYAVFDGIASFMAGAR